MFAPLSPDSFYKIKYKIKFAQVQNQKTCLLTLEDKALYYSVNSTKYVKAIMFKNTLDVLSIHKFINGLYNKLCHAFYRRKSSHLGIFHNPMKNMVQDDDTSAETPIKSA